MSRIRLYMAPMKGFTDHLFKSLFADHFGGFDLAVAPFIASKQDHRIKRKYVKDILPENNTCMPVVPQILSKTAADFIVLANYLYDLGYDTVNWNLGCPYPMVANKKRGSGMLPYTDRIRAFLDRVIHEIHGSLSIKLRLGWKKTPIFYGCCRLSTNTLYRKSSFIPEPVCSVTKGLWIWTPLKIAWPQYAIRWFTTGISERLAISGGFPGASTEFMHE